MNRIARLVFGGLSLVAAGVAGAQDFDQAVIRVEPVGDGLYVLFGEGGNVIAGNMLVSIGDEGVLLVDDQVPGMTPKYKAAIAELGGGDIDVVINTHWHFDHADGNQILGAEGARIMAHQNSRAMMMRDNVINLVSQTIEQPAYAESAWPDFTYDTDMIVRFNGNRIDLLHPGPAHTTGDTAVIFGERNLAHLGDVFNTSGYPFIDADNGGSLAGVISFCESVLAELTPGAVVIPGHGPVSNYQGLADYVAMLTAIHDRLADLIGSGMSLEQVIAAEPTADWDATRGDPAMLIDRAYASMTR
jgi:glyoxylase-like metal-dependent hydrolase (beta-lactamase superfamily II)